MKSNISYFFIYSYFYLSLSYDDYKFFFNYYTSLFEVVTNSWTFVDRF